MSFNWKRDELTLKRGRSFIKMHGLGNDFVIIDGREGKLVPSSEAARWVCDRYIGIGGDQLLVIEHASVPDADFRLRIYNVDGPEAPTCFNATRCAAWLIMQESGANSVTVQTMGGHIQAKMAGENRVSLRIEGATTEWRSIPLAGPLGDAGPFLINGELANPFAINLGNPHLVYFVRNWDKLDVISLAEPIQKSQYLPEQANIGVGEIMSPNRIKLVVYERPGILTKACGSGACAAVLAAHSQGLIADRQVTVEMPGGSLDIEVLGENTVILTGDVAIAFYGITAQELV